MALSRQEKERLLNEYGEHLDRAQAVIWAGFSGIDVAQMTAFRRQVQASGGEIVVVKNSLMKRALEARGLPYSHDIMAGPNVVAFAYDNMAATAKALADFARTSGDRLAIRGGIVGGRLADSRQVQSLAELPSREVLLARVLAGFQSPITGLVGTLAAVMRGMVNVLDARRQQLEGADA